MNFGTLDLIQTHRLLEVCTDPHLFELKVVWLDKDCLLNSSLKPVRFSVQDFASSKGRVQYKLQMSLSLLVGQVADER